MTVPLGTQMRKREELQHLHPETSRPRRTYQLRRDAIAVTGAVADHVYSYPSASRSSNERSARGNFLKSSTVVAALLRCDGTAQVCGAVTESSPQ